MSIPSYQEMLLPLLRLCADEKEHSKRSTIEELARLFELTDDERRQLKPSGRGRLFDTRIGWATTYLRKAGLIESPERAVLRITQRGFKLLREKPDELSLQDLKRFDEFKEFIARPAKKKESEYGDIEAEQNTPEEAIEIGYRQIREQLEADLLDQLLSCSPAFFEKLVVDLLVNMGYGGSLYDAGKAIGRTGDEGIDGIIKEDKLGLDVVYIQAKRWSNGSVGRREVQEFAGALQGKRARKGVFITTSVFTKDAKDYVERIDCKIVLIDGRQLSELMVDHNLGVSTVCAYELKKIDMDYFSEE